MSKLQTIMALQQMMRDGDVNSKLIDGIYPDKYVRIYWVDLDREP